MLSVVRHGRTAHNAGRRLLGRLDPPLDALGRRQADAIGRSLGPVDRIVTSPLLRTRQTAAAIAEVVDAPVEVDDRWIELDYGELDGVPLAEVSAELWSAWRADTGFAPPGGESLAELGRRVRSACESLATEAATSHVVVVSHVSPIKAAVGWALGVGDEVGWRMFVTPASLTRIAVSPRGPSLRGFNDQAHLADLDAD